MFWGVTKILLLVRGFRGYLEGLIDRPSKCSVSPGALTATADEVIMLGEKGSRL